MSQPNPPTVNTGDRIMKHYTERDIMQLDEDGNYYCRHMQAMTAEDLHCKSDIAAELAYRDSVIDAKDKLIVSVARAANEKGFDSISSLLTWMSETE